MILLATQPTPARLWSGLTIGFCFGLGWFACGLWWLYPGLHDFGATEAYFAALLVAGVIGYMSLFPALASGLIAHSGLLLRDAKASFMWRAIRLCAVAGIWAISEWLRGHLFIGLPWLETGYAHTTAPLAGYAPLIGVIGVGFMNSLIAILLAYGVLNYINKEFSVSGALQAVAAIAIVLAGGQLLRSIDWTEDTGRNVSVRLIQGNIAQEDKFSAEGLRQAANVYVEYSQTSSANLTIWPETIFSLEWHSLPDGIKQGLQSIANARASTILFGSPVVSKDPALEKTVSTNSALAISPGDEAGKYSYRYDKIHLLPLAEYVPPSLKWMGDQVTIDFNSYSAGAVDQAPLILEGGKFGLNICYETLFEDNIVRKARNAEALLNLSNFAWFTGTWAANQHLQAAQMRALETGRWLAQASNTGSTAVINQHGFIVDVLPLDTTAALDAVMQMRTGDTPFMRSQNKPILILSALALIALLGRRLRYKVKPTRTTNL
ncbi:apolipoprotein N-acyltransferase [Collimonas arenae]|uniref:Apolipoprotein N-acyltransferase n=1 Tax=Collimonas arenae TaxID=279058 RepID=A0A127QKL2_9BURK|nr:apolipoprotein N-acyltransferase [Collimonas arenae]AMP10599.1 apolipoprotein N-acyltransferase [Collimonas arenae]